MSLSPQLQPTDFKHLETVADRSEREQAYADHAIYTHDEPQGTRYTKGTSPMATKRSWQSLDAILRSDASASAALPRREMGISRVFTALTVVAGILTVAGAAASAREGLDLSELNGTGALLLGGGLATVGFGITSGVFYGKTRKGYERAVNIYNDSLAVRLGINTASGEYIPPAGTLIDEEGFIVLDSQEVPVEVDPEEGAPPVEGVAEEAAAEEAAADAATKPELPAEEVAPAADAPAGEAPVESAPAEEPKPEVPVQTVPVQSPTVPGTGSSAAAPHAGDALDLLPR